MGQIPTKLEPISNRKTGLLIVIDQALSSSTNFAATFIGLALLSSSDFGRLSFALATYYFALGVTRSFALDPVLVRPPDDVGATAIARYLVRVVGVVLASVLVVVGLALKLGELVALGVLLPFLFGVEYLRVRSFQRRQPIAAVSADAIWGASLLTLLTAFWLFDLESSATVFLMLWGVPAALIGGYAFSLRSLPTPPRLLHKPAIRRGLHYASALVLSNGSLYLVIVAVAVFLGSEALGYYGAARAAYGPVNTGLAAFDSYFIPRHGPNTSSPRRIGRGGFRAGLLLGTCAFLIASVSQAPFVQDIVSSLGESGPGVAPLLWPMGLFVTGQALAYPARSVIRRLHRESWVTGVQALNSAAIILVVFFALPGGGLEMLVWLMTATAFLFSSLWWLIAFRAVRTPGHHTEPSGKNRNE